MTTILDSWNCRGTPPAAHHLPAMAARVRNPKAKANQNRAHDHSLAHCEHAAACCLQKEQPAPPSPNSHAAGARPSHAIRASRFPVPSATTLVAAQGGRPLNQRSPPCAGGILRQLYRNRSASDSIKPSSSQGGLSRRPYQVRKQRKSTGQ